MKKRATSSIRIGNKLVGLCFEDRETLIGTYGKTYNG